MTATLGVLALLGSGLTAGVLFAVALSTLPALFAMPPSTYVYAHQLLGRNWDPTMPAIVLTSTVADILLAVRATGAACVLAVLAAVLMLGVSAVSHLANVPINRRVKAITDAERLPDGWIDPRPLWRRWHFLRTGLAVVALAVNGAAVALS